MDIALPSSPPPLPEESFSSSPPQLPCYRVRSRKRRLSASAGLSSDPLFSEDASDPELDDGDLPQRKRLFRGPWWTVTRRKSAVIGLRHELGRRGLRVADSGVWMPSDDSEQERASVDISSDLETPEDIQYKAINLRSPVEHEDDQQDVAMRVVHLALEQGRESIDLSGLKLGIISNAMLRPLHQLVRQPQDHGAYRSLIPELQLFMQGNELSTLPTELFSFTNITVLSLRNNRLRALPPALFRLPQLTELNVSGNELSYLPWEALLQTHKSGAYKMICAPNPFHEVELDPIYEKRLTSVILTVLGHMKAGQTASCYVASSTIQWFNSHGTPISSPRAEADSIATNSRKDFTPTLFEYALRRAQKAHALPEAIAMLPSYVPRGIINALHDALTAGEVGNDRCALCDREMIIAKAQWVEYWSELSSIDPREDCLPYMRRVCSSACARPSTIGAHIVSGLGLRSVSPDHVEAITE
ncbi:hypothetical protein AMS68_002223 [Peltaster fructicola]|uniref:Uncharacterized protein n=1 Tax=Peltaster fructicola TaxID=286661 RepID=A0A6H0XPU4_9PEZI|nr:hypothetical protein AMS68_002223 [Peltaster fructicola]